MKDEHSKALKSCNSTRFVLENPLLARNRLRRPVHLCRPEGAVGVAREPFLVTEGRGPCSLWKSVRSNCVEEPCKYKIRAGGGGGEG